MTVNEQKIQRSNKGFDILYRVVTALVAAATFPVMIFTSLFYFAYTIPYISLLTGDSSDSGASFFSASIYELMKDITGGGNLFTGKDATVDIWGVVEAVKPQLIAIGCLYAAVVVLALVIIIFAAFTRKKLPIVISSVLGIGALSFIPLAFSKLTAPFIDGTLNIDSFLHTGLESIMNLVATVDYIRAGEAYTFLWVIFMAILAWTGAVMLVSMGDEPKAKKQKVKKPKKEKEQKVKTVEE